MRNALFAGAALALVSLTACDSAGPPADSRSAPVTLSITAAEGNAGAAAKSRTFTDEVGNALTVDRTEIVLREIEFERDETTQSCPSAESGADDDSSSDDGCEKIERGPFLVDVPLTSDDPTSILQAELPEGRWEEVEFEVHKLDDDDPEDRQLLEDTGFPRDVSVRVTGTWTPASGPEMPFTYMSDLNEDQEIELNPPLDVTADSPANVTFRLALSTWFRDGRGLLVDPDRGNDDGDLEDLIEDNIERSIEAFEDDDRDGFADDNGRDDDDDDDR